MTGLHPYAEGSIAAARRDIAKCLEEMSKALRAPGTEGWHHVGLAHAHAASAKAKIDAAYELDELAAGLDEEGSE